MACPASVVLPQVKRTTEANARGTYRHRFLEGLSLGQSRADTLADIPEEYREECEAIDTEGLPTGLAAEVTFAWDSETLEVRELGRCLTRDYSKARPTEIVGTIDVLGVSDTEVYVGDYKGHAPVDVVGNAQLMLAALCACRLYGKDRATLEIIQVRGSSNHRKRTTVDLFDLGVFEVALQSLVGRIRHASTLQRPDVTEGTHCRWCSAFEACPAKTAHLVHLAHGSAANEVELLNPLSPETAAEAYRQWLAAKSLVKRMGSILHAYAAERPIELGDGRYFGRHEKPGRESLDGDVTYAQIREAYGQEAADIAVKRTATKKGIEAAVRHVKSTAGLSGSMKAENAKVLEAIRDAGGSERKTSVAIEEYQGALPAKGEAA